MRTFAALTGLLAYCATTVSATALTYRLEAHERACFFTNVETKGTKVAFYFAVQSGGSFDVDYAVTGPGDRVILDGTKERQGDFVFTANDEGEYRFCFNNEMSTFAEKTVDFEIAVRAPFHPTIIPDTSFFEALTPPQLQRWISNYNSRYEKGMMSNAGAPQVENEVRAQLPSKQGSTPEQTSVLEESILKLSAQLSTISRSQKYFRTRENRNFSTVKSTEKRIFNFSMMEPGNLYGLLQPGLPPLGLFALPRPSGHPPLHPNVDSSNKRKRVEFIDLTSDADGTSTELQPHSVKRPRLSPPKSAPPQLSPTKKRKKQPIGALRKKQQDEQVAQSTADEQLAGKLQEAQSTADEQLARELQEVEHRNGKARRLRNKIGSPEKCGERSQRQRSLKSASPEKRLGKKLSVYEEFQRIEEEAAQGKQRQRSLRIASPEKHSQRTLRSSSPEKQPGKKLSVYEEFQTIEREAAQGKHPSKKRSVYEKAQKIQQEAAQGKHPSKKLSVYEEFQKIQQEAAQGQSTRTKKRILRSASPENSTKRTRRGNTPEQRKASKQSTRATMHRINSTEELNTLEAQLRTQSRAPASAEDDRRKMPPPPPPMNATDYPMLSAQNTAGHTMLPAQNTTSHPMLSAQNITGHPMLSAQNISGDIIPKGTQSRPMNPLNPPMSLPTNQDILHKSKNARVTKQSYHTAHKQPYSTQETQRLAQFHDASLRAQERTRQERQEVETYIQNHTRQREASQNGVHMFDVEYTHVAFDMCQYFNSIDYRYGHLPSMNPDLPVPSIEHEHLGAAHDRSTPVVVPPLEEVFGLGREPAGPDILVDLTTHDPESTEKELTPLFDAPVPHDRFINAFELPAYNPITASDADFFPLEAGHETGTFLEPEWDKQEGCWRAPEPGTTQEGAIVGELLQYVQEEKTCDWTDEASGWV
ncbi:uncharacterized protein N0V89_010684 [Didymosphaeria variabile]|uniref:GOLD domain-containing protein n=1 Tax=Didymosphaeria variabile TaxID=1932322 RepID=A0A9W8XCM5_9PLEO|nr:uncharacterized protein N0V89_010684 [Didymosphaeria variabile]KAJ4346752.1 hypothetical protein N0V89_010684 [Didymosphaeria variabile]